MNLISKHPFSFLFAGAGIVLLVIILFAKGQSSPQTQTPTTYVGGENALVYPGISGAEAHKRIENPVQPPETLADSFFTYTRPTLLISDTARPKKPTPTPSLISITDTGSTAAQTPTESDQLLQYVYSLIPTGISTPIATPKARSPDQQALYIYGNEAGHVVFAFTDAHADTAQVLQDWFTNRANPAKAAGLNTIADDLTATGKDLEALPDVPASARAANAALAKAYEDAGSKLIAVGDAGGDDKRLVEAMKTYNAAADSFTTSYIALAQIFSLYDVRFGASDPGSAFSMPQ